MSASDRAGHLSIKRNLGAKNHPQATPWVSSSIGRFASLTAPQGDAANAGLETTL